MASPPNFSRNARANSSGQHRLSHHRRGRHRADVASLRRAPSGFPVARSTVRTAASASGWASSPRAPKAARRWSCPPPALRPGSSFAARRPAANLPGPPGSISSCTWEPGNRGRLEPDPDLHPLDGGDGESAWPILPSSRASQLTWLPNPTGTHARNRGTFLREYRPVHAPSRSPAGALLGVGVRHAQRRLFGPVDEAPTIAHPARRDLPLRPRRRQKILCECQRPGESLLPPRLPRRGMLFPARWNAPGRLAHRRARISGRRENPHGRAEPS